VHAHFDAPDAGHTEHGRRVEATPAPRRAVTPRSSAALTVLATLAGLLPVALAVCLVVTPGTAGAATAGVAQITQPGQTTPLDGGGSATPYAVALPGGASCPGDTAHDGYHVYSYLVPKGVSPTAVSFKTGDPNKWYGYIDYGDFFAAANTAEDTGQIMALPHEFSWSRYSSYMGDLFPHGVTTATWEGGIACANTHGVVTNYWNSEIVFTKSSSDPGGFTWKVKAAPPAAAASSSDLALWLGVALVVLAVVFASLAVVLSRRRRRAERAGKVSNVPTAPSDEASRQPTTAGR
jgi:hypothetical protein